MADKTLELTSLPDRKVGEVLFRGLLKVHLQSAEQPLICVHDKIGKLTAKTQEHTGKKATDNKSTGSKGFDTHTLSSFRLP